MSLARYLLHFMMVWYWLREPSAAVFKQHAAKGDAFDTALVKTIEFGHYDSLKRKKLFGVDFSFMLQVTLCYRPPSDLHNQGKSVEFSIDIRFG